MTLGLLAAVRRRVHHGASLIVTLPLPLAVLIATMGADVRPGTAPQVRA
jgi:hypothetical protein